MAPDAGLPEVAVLVPCRNEAGNLPELIGEIEAALRGRAIEIIVIDDGSEDGTAEVTKALMTARPHLRLIRHARSCGQSAALRSGLLAARAPLILTTDGDGQNDPAAMPALLAALEQGGPGMGIAAGQRLKRTDTGAKRLASRLANNLRAAMLKDGMRDSGCGLKALRREAFLLFPYFDGWHRYLPALAIREGYSVARLDVVDRSRRHGVSNYGILDRGLRGALDLLGVWWLLKRRRHLPRATEISADD